MRRVAQKELRNQIGEVLRRAEAGEELEITVSGRPVAKLGPLGPPTYVSAARLREIYLSPTDPGWMDDIGELGAELTDPWQQQ